MSLFWILSAALLLAVLAALLWPLLRTPRAGAPDSAGANLRVLREQLTELDKEAAAGSLLPEQYAAARAELERRVLDESTSAELPLPARPARASALLLTLALPMLALVLYAVLGNPQGFDPLLNKSASQATEQDVETLVERLAQRMQEQPGDPEGWVLLGRSYAAMQRFGPASEAYARAVALLPDNPHLLADYADALAMTQDSRLDGEPMALIQRALASDPDHLKALALAGSAAMQRGDFRAAVDHWTHARRVAPPDSPFIAGLDESLNEARSAAGLPQAGAVAGAMTGAAPAAQGSMPTPAQPSAGAKAASLRVQVSLAPALAARVQPGDTVFVYARAAEGPRMPLAIARHKASELPLAVTLDDSMAMTPQMRLSAFDRVVVEARVSRSGDATPQAGDLEGQSQPLSPHGAAAVTLRIDRSR